MVHKLPIQKAANGRWIFQPWFYAGVNKRTNIPIWSQQQENAKPLALDGVVGGSPFEEQPLVNQLSVSWVGGTIKKWVMLYAGNSGDFYLADPANDRPGEGPGSIRIRFAERGDRGRPEPPAGGLAVRAEYAARRGSMFHRSASTSGLRARSDAVRDDFYVGCFPIGKTFDNGFLYAPNIIDSYTESDGAGGMNIYWDVSIWNPYAVLYLKTNLKPE
jgi:hypothetical protein